MAIIRVPKPPKSAYNPKRRPGTLLQHQLIHLEWAARPAAQRRPHLAMQWKPAKTEAEAARRIAALTEHIHRHAAATAAGYAPPTESRLPTKRRQAPRPTRAVRSKR
jgi:hypothetical protein